MSTNDCQQENATEPFCVTDKKTLKSTKAVINKRNKEEFVKERYTSPICKSIMMTNKLVLKSESSSSVIVCRKGRDKGFPNVPLYPLYIFYPRKLVLEKIHFLHPKLSRRKGRFCNENCSLHSFCIQQGRYTLAHEQISLHLNGGLSQQGCQK